MAARTRAEVGERRVRKDGVWEKTGPGKWSKVKDQAVIDKTKRQDAARKDPNTFARIFSGQSGEAKREQKEGPGSAGKFDVTREKKTSRFADIFADTERVDAHRKRMESRVKERLKSDGGGRFKEWAGSKC